MLQPWRRFMFKPIYVWVCCRLVLSTHILLLLSFDGLPQVYLQWVTILRPWGLCILHNLIAQACLQYSNVGINVPIASQHHDAAWSSTRKGTSKVTFVTRFPETLRFLEERISLMVLEGSTVDLIIGRPWMSQHDPNINWNSGEILQWSESCFKDCLSSMVKPPARHACLHTAYSSPCVHMNSTSVICPEIESKVEIPAECRAFQDVFSKRLATHLPPHLPWDCAIDLLPGATPPKGKVYPLSIRNRRPWRSISRRL